jgi:hypothetical protein
LYALRITFPEDEQAFSDSDPLAAGMQISVRVEAADDDVPIELVRLTGGTPEVIMRKLTKAKVAGFTCSVRGYDRAGAYTPLGASLAFSAQLPTAKHGCAPPGVRAMP